MEWIWLVHDFGLLLHAKVRTKVMLTCYLILILFFSVVAITTIAPLLSKRSHCIRFCVGTKSSLVFFDFSQHKDFVVNKTF